MWQGFIMLEIKSFFLHKKEDEIIKRSGVHPAAGSPTATLLRLRSSYNTNVDNPKKPTTPFIDSCKDLF